MAISKDDVVSKTSAEIESIMKQVEPEIDAKLANYIDGGRVCIYTMDIKSFPKDSLVANKVINEIKKRYSKPGTDWKVDYNFDQREGGWFTFS